MEFIVHVNTLITDKKGRILFVREKKEKIYNLLNLPGGHLNHGEEIVEGAAREAKEEASVDIKIEGLIGLYTGLHPHHYLGFVFAGKIIKGTAKANPSEVKGIEWLTLDEIDRLPDGEMVNPPKNRAAIKAFRLGKIAPVEVIREMLKKKDF